MTEKIDIAKLNIDQADLEASNARLITQIGTIKDSMKDLRKETGNMTNATSEQSEEYVRQDAELKKLNTEYNRQKAVLAENTTSVKGLTDALDKENQSIEAARENNKELLAARNRINAGTKEGQKAIEQINQKLDQNNKFIKQNSSELEKQKINIGNYASALDRVVPGLGSVATGLQAGADKSRIFGTALKAIPIFAILSGIVALASAFASTQQGLDKINATLAPLRGGFQSIIGVVQDISLNLFSQLADRWTVAKNNILGGINQLRIGWNKLTGDIAETKELQAYQDQLENELTAAQQRLNEKTAELSKIWDGAADRIKEGAKNYEEIERLQIAIERKQVDMTVPLAKANNEFRKLKQAAEDVTKTEDERLEAARKAEEQLSFIIGQQQELQDLKIRQKELENSLNDTSRADEQELQNLIKERYEVETSGVEQLTTLQNLKNTITLQGIAKEKQAVKDALELEKKAAEEALQIAKQADEKAANERRLRQAIEFQEELVRLEEEGAGKEALLIARINNEEQLKIEAAEREIENKELLERELSLIEAQADKDRREVRQISESEQLEQTKQFYGNLSELLGKDTVAAKAAGIAKATINTYQGVSEVFRAPSILPEPFGTLNKIVNAGLILKSGLNAANKISGVQIPKAEKGALIELGGRRHSQGGTTLFDESGRPLVEAEKGEVMGVMNRNAARLFMDFNNRYQDGSYQNMFSQTALSGRSGGSVQVPGMTDKKMVRELKELRNELRNKPVASVNVDQDGFETYVSDGYQKEIYLNKKFNG